MWPYRKSLDLRAPLDYTAHRTLLTLHCTSIRLLLGTKCLLKTSLEIYFIDAFLKEETFLDYKINLIKRPHACAAAYVNAQMPAKVEEKVGDGQCSTTKLGKTSANLGKLLQTWTAPNSTFRRMARTRECIGNESFCLVQVQASF